jgi:abnormal spindle-like microcephaly-associated protein
MMRGIVTLQALFRRKSEQKTYRILKRSSWRIQTWYLRIRRAWKQKQLLAVILIQKKYRAYKKKQRFFEVCEFRKKQKMHQKYKSAKIIQRYARGSAVYKQFTLKKKGVLRLQSIVRGIIARKRSSKLLVEARMRVQKAIEEGKEEEKLGNRTDVALNILLTSNNLSGVKRAAVTLEISTKISHVCAKRFVQKGAVAIIYRLIRSCNRSQPHRAVLSHALNVLRQVSPFETVLNNFSPSKKYRMETLVELLQTFRTEHIRIRQILHLIADVCKDKVFLSELSKSKDIIKRLSSILKLLKRKAKAENKENVTHYQGKVKKKKAVIQRNIVNLEKILQSFN